MPQFQDDDREICTHEERVGFEMVPPGSAVVARREHWRVDCCLAHDDCSEVHLAGESGTTVLLSPFDRFQPIDADGRLRVVRLREWSRHLDGLAAGIRVGRLHAVPGRARLLGYQLAPALAAAAGCSRLLLADEVGLGKTVQAGWIVADTLDRHPDARVLIAVPAGLRRQWQSELSALFGVDAVVADARWLRRTASTLPGDISPWSLPGVSLVSLDFVKRADVVRSLEYQTWDLLVVDEVHTAAAPTDRHRALAAIASRSRCVVLISATPFSGEQQSLSSIASLGGDGSDQPLMFRRSREDVDLPGTRRHRFGLVSISRPERRLQRLMERYSLLVWRDAPGDGDAARLAMTVLRKRALSSPAAVLNSLQRRLRLLATAAPPPKQLSLFDRDEDPLDDEEPEGILAPPGMLDGDLERRWLIALIDAAAAAARPDSKLAFLRRLIRRLQGDSAIVFTEYRDTLAHLSTAFPAALLLHGGSSADDRDEIRRRFNVSGGLLIATDAAAEGLNLHGRCRLVINYELPWNPARLEQRIGRVDRVGQERAVHALTLVARDTAEQLVLARLTRRLHRIAATLGERDRLSAFLTEARVAGMVIGGAAVDEPPEPTPLTSVRRAIADVELEAAESVRLALIVRGVRSSRRDILVSTIVPGRFIKKGLLFVVSWQASTDEGRVIDSDVRVFHVAARPGGVRTRGAVRAVAASAIIEHGDVCTSGV